MHIPTWFGEEGRHVTRRAFSFAFENYFPIGHLGRRARSIGEPTWSYRRGYSQLIKMERRELRSDQILIASNICQIPVARLWETVPGRSVEDRRMCPCRAFPDWLRRHSNVSQNPSQSMCGGSRLPGKTRVVSKLQRTFRHHEKPFRRQRLGTPS